MGVLNVQRCKKLKKLKFVCFHNTIKTNTHRDIIMFASLYYTLFHSKWKQTPDEDTKAKHQSIALKIEEIKKQHHTLSIYFDQKDGSVVFFDNITHVDYYKIVKEMQKNIATFLFENQKFLYKISATESATESESRSARQKPLLEILYKNGCFQSWIKHSHSYFMCQLFCLWCNYVASYLDQKNQDNTKHVKQRVINNILKIYSSWDIDYTYNKNNPNVWKKKMFRNTNIPNLFINLDYETLTLDEMIRGLVFYQDHGVGYGLYESSFYNVLFYYMLRDLHVEISELWQE